MLKCSSLQLMASGRDAGAGGKGNGHWGFDHASLSTN